jgi:hypothetical protein
MLWNGTVTITPDCSSDAARVGGDSQPPCIKQKQKQEAEKAAQEDRDCVETENNVIHTIRLGTKNRFMFKVRAASASMAAVFYGLERASQAIADDPPTCSSARSRAPTAHACAAWRRSDASYRPPTG